MRLLLDTCSYSDMRRGDPETARLVRAAAKIYLSAIVVGELMSGFRSGSRMDSNLRELEEFLASPFVEFLPVTLTTADRFARISADLRAAGTPIPTNDVWIASHALEKGADLVSTDTHFERIRGLVWIDPSRK